MLKKKIPFDKISSTKNPFFFLLQSRNQRFTSNLQLIYEQKQKVRLPKTVIGSFNFQLCFVFIKVCVFVQQNAWTDL